MEVADFCKMFLFSLLNLFCYLLSIIFLTSTYNIKDQIFYIKIWYGSKTSCHYNVYLNHYSGISALFAFITLGLIFYTTVLLIYINKYKIDKEKDSSYQNNNLPNNYNNVNNANNANNINNENNINIGYDVNIGNNINSKEKIYVYNENNINNINNENNINNINNINNENIWVDPYNQYQQNEDNNNPNQANLLIMQSYNSNEELPKNKPQINSPIINNNDSDALKTDDFAKLLMKILLGSFIACQLLYFIELIVLSAFHRKSKSMEQLEDNDECGLSNFTRVYRDLIIVGYIFFAILLVFYIILLIYYNKFGESQKNKLEGLRFCKICDDCIIAGCKQCTDLFHTRTEEEKKQFLDNEAKKLEGTNEQKDIYINNLKNYKSDLNELVTSTDTETDDTYESKLNKLHLHKIILNKT